MEKKAWKKRPKETNRRKNMETSLESTSKKKPWKNYKPELGKNALEKKH